MLLPRLEQIHVDRDHAAGRTSDLDPPNVRQLWRQLILAHTVGDQVEVDDSRHQRRHRGVCHRAT